MKKRELCSLILGLIVWVSFTSVAWAAMAVLQDEATHALRLAMTRLGNPTDSQNMVCLTNAGYVMVQGEGTLTLCKAVRDVCGSIPILMPPCILLWPIKPVRIPCRW